MKSALQPQPCSVIFDKRFLETTNICASCTEGINRSMPNGRFSWQRYSGLTSASQYDGRRERDTCVSCHFFERGRLLPRTVAPHRQRFTAQYFALLPSRLYCCNKQKPSMLRVACCEGFMQLLLLARATCVAPARADKAETSHCGPGLP